MPFQNMPSYLAPQAVITLQATLPPTRMHLLPPRTQAPDDNVAAAAISTRCHQIMQGAWALEAVATRSYQEGVNILLTAMKIAEEAEAMAAGAEAKVRSRVTFPALI